MFSCKRLIKAFCKICGWLQIQARVHKPKEASQVEYEHSCGQIVMNATDCSNYSTTVGLCLLIFALSYLLFSLSTEYIKIAHST